MDWLIENEVARCGKNKRGLNVYYFRQLGYWVCPPMMYLTYNKHRLISATIDQHGGEVRRTTSRFDAESLKRFLRVAVTNTQLGMGLYTAPVTRRDFHYTVTEKQPFLNKPGIFSVTIIPPLRAKYGTNTYRGYYDNHNTRQRALKDVQTFNERQLDILKSNYSTDIDSFCTFHDELPM